MVILGIDPGLICAGFSVVKKGPRYVEMLDCGYLALKSTQSIPLRVSLFHQFFDNKITQWKVNAIALETPFLGKNAQNFLKLGYLRGIVYLLSEHRGLPLHEFAPCEVKQALTGFGGASKDQVERVIKQLFPKMPEVKKQDTTDAVAIALCGLWRGTMASYR